MADTQRNDREAAVALKLCPFCESDDLDHEAWASQTKRGPGCMSCGATAETKERWNTRPLEEAQSSELEHLRERVEELELYEDVYECCQELLDPHLSIHIDDGGLPASVGESVSVLIQFWKNHGGGRR
jgi:hypothetical protein